MLNWGWTSKIFAGTFVVTPRLGCIIAVGMLGCGAADGGNEDGALGNSEDPLYYESAVLWPTRNIPVCWRTAGSATEKLWVKQALEGPRSWQAAGGIDFTGWGDCGSSTTGIQIQFSGSARVHRFGYSNSEATGMTLDFRSDVASRYPRCANHGLNREKCIKAVALHEFGHAIAYHHEHLRPDPPSNACDDADTTLDVVDGLYGDWDHNSIMNYCNAPAALSGVDRRGTDYLYGAPFADYRRLNDYNGDNRVDLLCQDVLNGVKFVDYADTAAHWATTDHQMNGPWCNHNEARVYAGDFNGDNRDDLLCHDIANGNKWIDFASTSGQFAGTDSTITGWCGGPKDRLYIGRFNADARADLLCQDETNGITAVDHASSTGTFTGTNWTKNSVWCPSDDFQRLYIGDFNADGRDDLLCHAINTGRRWLDYADAAGQFNGTDWTTQSAWCNHPSAELHVGDFDADARSDLLCHDVSSGYKWIDFGHNGLNGTDWERDAKWCGFNFNTARLYIGDVNADGRDDLVCHDTGSGRKWIDYAFPGENFIGTDWEINNGWCTFDSLELH